MYHAGYVALVPAWIIPIPKSFISPIVLISLSDVVSANAAKVFPYSVTESGFDTAAKL